MIHKFICPKAGNCPYFTCSHRDEHDECDECNEPSEICPACTRYTGIIPMNIWETLRHNINQVQGENLGNNTYTVPMIYKSRLKEFYNECHYKTIDKYLYYLRKAGYLYSVGRGIYQRVADIPHMSLTEIRNEAQGPRVVLGVDRAANRAANFESITASAGYYRVDGNNHNHWSINAETGFEHKELTLEQKKEIFKKTYNVPKMEEFLSEKDMQIE